MSFLRILVTRHRALAMILVVAALCLKAAVPAGYMVDSGATTLTMRLCEDGLGNAIVKQVAIPGRSGENSGSRHADDAGACPYSALAMAAVHGADPIQLALALVFILAIGFVAAAISLPARTRFLTPPLRGPPRLA